MTPQEFNIALARLDLGRRELAADTGIDKDTISKYRHGRLEVPKLLQRYLELRLEVLG